MHSFFATRGCKRDVDEFVKFLETRALPMPYITADGKKETTVVSGLLQPVQLWSYVFPENCKDAVLTSLRFDEENISRWSTNWKMKAMVESLRIAMGAKKIPEFSKKDKLFMPEDSIKNISIIPIGVKYDDLNWKDPNGTIHEAL